MERIPAILPRREEVCLTRTALLRGLREALETRLDSMSSMIQASRDEATSAESRPENKYDTRALEASYLAAGQGARLAELKDLVRWLSAVDDTPRSRVGAGAFAQIEDAEVERWVFIAPQGGYTASEPVEVQVVGTTSPLGRALLGCEAGDAGAFTTPRGEREFEVLAVW